MLPTTEPLAYTSIIELASAYRAGTVSPLQVTEQTLDRIAHLDPTLRSYVTVTAEIAGAQARQAADEIRHGQWRGPLHGVPIGIKDLCETRGVRTTWGTTIFADHVPRADATVVRKLFDAGAVMIGKLQMTEGAFAEHHPALPVPVNPWHADHWPGASSSGSGVATAAGLCCAAIGTDTGGSIRFPCGANGLTGIKPTWGRVSRAGVLPLAESLDHVGPMARSAADAAAMLGAIAGVDALDPTTLEADVPHYLAGLDQGVEGLRVGIDERYACDGIDADTASVIDHVRQVMTALGAVVVDVSMPETTATMIEQWSTVCSVETAIAHQQTYPSRRHQYGPVLAELIEQGWAVSAIELMRVQQARLQFSGALRKLFQRIDLLLAPVHPFGNPTIARLDAILEEPGGVDQVLRFTAPFDLSGSPTITLPGGFSAEGLPIGFQFVGRHLDEALLIRAAHAFQQATSWHHQHPIR